MKKQFFAVIALSALFINSAYAAVKVNNYTLVEDLSKDTTVSVWSKNSLWWDNWGWCDGANNSNSPLTIKPGTKSVYCGGNIQFFGRAWSDTPRLQHEWWFSSSKYSWKQTYSEQWLTYIDPTVDIPVEKFSLHAAITQVVPNNNWEHSLSYYTAESMMSLQDDNKYDVTVDSLFVYKVLNDHEMTLDCYKLPYGSVVDYNDLKSNTSKYTSGVNFCGHYDGSPRIIEF